MAFIINFVNLWMKDIMNNKQFLFQYSNFAYLTIEKWVLVYVHNFGKKLL